MAKLYVCDGCNAEYTGDATDAAQIGWRDHKYEKNKKEKFFLLCNECEDRYQGLWDLQESYKEAWK